MKNMLVLQASLTGGGGKVKQKNVDKYGNVDSFIYDCCLFCFFLAVYCVGGCLRKGKNIGNELNIG